MKDKKNEAFRRVQEKKETRINELLQQQEYLRSEIETGHHVARNQFKLINVSKKLRRVRYGKTSLFPPSLAPKTKVK